LLSSISILGSSFLGLSCRLLQPLLADADGNIDDGANDDEIDDKNLFDGGNNNDGGGGGTNTEHGISINTALFDDSPMETVRFFLTPNSRYFCISVRPV